MMKEANGEEESSEEKPAERIYTAEEDALVREHLQTRFNEAECEDLFGIYKRVWGVFF